MADNKVLPATGTGSADVRVPTAQGTYSGDTVDAPMVGLLGVTGAEGARTLTDIGASNPLPVAEQKAATATLSNVGDSASSVTLLSSLATRLGAIIHNDSTSRLLIKYGSTASATSYTYPLAAGAIWEMPEPIYTGIITGIWDADAGGNARITELTA